MKTLPRRVLVADNDADILIAVGDNLADGGYEVLTADHPQQAINILKEEIIHLAVIDLRLKNNHQPDDISGLEVAQSAPAYVPCIIFTAYEDNETIKRALGKEVNARRVIDKQKPTGASELIDAIADLFQTDVKVNFDLVIDGTPVLDLLAQQIDMTFMDAPLPPAGEDVEQILRVLFCEATKIQYEPLLSPEPARTITQSGSRLLLVRPQFDTPGAPVVVKLGTCDEVKQEARNYRRYRRYLIGQRLPVLDLDDGIAYSRQIGGLRYSLIYGGDSPKAWEALRVFGKVFLEEDTPTVISLLERFFSQTLGTLFENARRQSINLTEMYTAGLHLTPDKLLNAMQIVAPESVGEPQIRFEGLRGTFPNPILWALPNGRFRHINVVSRTCLCHGDLHGRNILVDATGNFWLIDFARVDESHALRDFAELETDIKFNLLPVVDLQALLPFEQALLTAATFQDAPPAISFHNERLNHAYQVVLALRRVAAEKLGLNGDMSEYYYALFFHTLNILRLRHIGMERKKYALLAAALTAQRLAAEGPLPESWPDWKMQQATFSPVLSLESKPSAPENAVAQETSADAGAKDTSRSTPGNRLFVVSVSLLVGVVVVVLLWMGMYMLDPSWTEHIVTLLYLALLIIPAFVILGVLSGETAVQAIQNLIHLLFEQRPRPPDQGAGS